MSFVFRPRRGAKFHLVATLEWAGDGTYRATARLDCRWIECVDGTAWSLWDDKAPALTWVKCRGRALTIAARYLKVRSS